MTKPRWKDAATTPLLFLLALPPTNPAQASILTYQFSGKLFYAYDPDKALVKAGIGTNSLFSGTFSYDSAASASFSNFKDPGYNYTYYDKSPVALSLTVAGNKIVSTVGGYETFLVRDGISRSEFDNFQILYPTRSLSSSIHTGLSSQASISYSGASSSFTGTALPTEFPTRNLRIDFSNDSPSSYGISGNIDQISLMSTTQPINQSINKFAFPMKSGEPVQLTTQAGGISSISDPVQGYFDHYHQPDQGYYSLDFDSQHATVIAARDGVIKSRDGDGQNGKCSNLKYYCVEIDHKDGLISIYQEFGEGKNLRTGDSYRTGDTVKLGDPLGTLSEVAGQHLHFQVMAKENGVYTSHLSNSSLTNIEVGGRLFKDYKLEGTYSVSLIDGKYVVDGIPKTSLVYGQLNPLLPTTSDPLSQAYLFNVVAGDLGVGKDLPIYVDPIVTSGYDFDIINGSKFTAVQLPHLGNSKYELYRCGKSQDEFVFDSLLEAGEWHSFGALGTSCFRVLGIDTKLAIDPADSSAFVVGLKFASNGDESFRMSAITSDVPETSTVPEPLAWILLLVGFGGVGSIMRIRRRFEVFA